MKTGMRQLAWALAMMMALPGGEQVAIAAAKKPPPDRPPRIRKQSDIKFPQRLIALGVTSGAVQLMLDVDADGTLADHLIVAFTHHEFANEVSRTVARWRYEPAIVNGRPIAATITLNIRFSTHGVVVRERQLMEEAPAPGEFEFRARSLSELDAVPRLLVRVEPMHPGGDLRGRVRVAFFIDETGRVRMPTVIEADDPRLGWSVLGAVAKWEFEIPRRAGHPVLARATQVFVFADES